MVTTRSQNVAVPQGEEPSANDHGHSRRIADADGHHRRPSARSARAGASMLLSSSSSSTAALPPFPASVPSAAAHARTPRKRRRENDGGSIKNQPEKRAKAYRRKPPKSFLDRLERALTQRLCVLKRERVDNDLEPSERFTLSGSTGNVYIVVIRKVPSCTCPDAGKGNQCKHIIYELRDIFDNSPPAPSANASLENEDGHRKPIEGECPICFMPLEPETSEVIWCKAKCGNNIHKSCFKQWAATARAECKHVKCVYCRTPWAPDVGDVHHLLTSATLSNEGYLNIAEALNLSNDRGTIGTSSLRGSLATLFVTSWTHETIQRIISHGRADDFIVTSNSPRASGILTSGQPILVDSIVIHWDGASIQKIDFHCKG
ncbi:hypothetical protein KEM56_005249 [Ascosphaera pollenicola]|nr:hypothetical protein KEM56_005249 [Ascosphaera pollenicola]